MQKLTFCRRHHHDHELFIKAVHLLAKLNKNPTNWIGNTEPFPNVTKEADRNSEKAKFYRYKFEFSTKV